MVVLGALAATSAGTVRNRMGLKMDNKKPMEVARYDLRAVCQASRKDTLDFLSVAVDASRNGQQQRLAAARWAARTQDRLRIIQAINS